MNNTILTTLRRPAIILSTTLSMMATASNTVAAEETQCPDWTSAQLHYQINDAARTNAEVVLWRQEGQAAWQYPQQKLVRLWERSSGDRLHLVQLFEDHQKGIEYQPGEIQSPPDWSYLYSAVDQRLMGKLASIREQGSGCEKVVTYSGKSGAEHLRIEWMPQQQIARLITAEGPAGTTTWKLLQSSRDVNAIQARFEYLSTYQLTDYADIGDNESDPFLSLLIRQGFVAHGSDGFYDAQGQQPTGHHH